jgi:glucokinase
MSRVILGVDMGGTTIAAGLVTEEGQVLAQEVIPTHQAGAGRALENLWYLLDRLVSEAKRQGLTLAAIGVGVPGSVEISTGTIGQDIPNVPELAGSPLATLLKERYGVSAFIDNDVNLLTLDAWFFGAGQGVSSLVVLAVGTGVGGGVILNGELLRGASGYGGELGHMTINFDGRACFCGGRGCLKTYVSGPDIVAQAIERLDAYPSSLLSGLVGGDARLMTTRHVFEAERAGDPLAVALIDDVCQALGAGIGAIVNGLNPERLLLRGGVAESLCGHFPRILEWVRRYAFAGALAGTEIVCIPSEKRSTARSGAALVRYEASRSTS